jgi:hypothetical protein
MKLLRDDPFKGYSLYGCHLSILMATPVWASTAGQNLLPSIGLIACRLQ